LELFEFNLIDSENEKIGLLEEFTYLEKLIENTWGSLITSQLTEGMEKMQEIFGKFEELFQNIVKIKHENQNTINSLINSDLKLFNNVFLQLEEAMLTPDYILLGDLLKYEILPLLKNWRLTLCALKLAKGRAMDLSSSYS